MPNGSESSVEQYKTQNRTECVWCPNGNCTENIISRCEPIDRLQEQGIETFEECLISKYTELIFMNAESEVWLNLVFSMS